MEMLRRAVLRRRAQSFAASGGATSKRCVQTTTAAVNGGAAEDEGAAQRTPPPLRAAGSAMSSTAPLPPPIATAMALADQLEHPETSRIGKSLLLRPNWTPDAEGSGLTNAELKRAKECLELLRDRVERECEERDGAPPSTEQQCADQRQKATTRRLGRMLVALMRQGNYRDIEGIAFLWEEVFPQYARNGKHWGVICEHYAVALNKQRRYSEVVEKLFTNWFVSLEEEDTENAVHAMARQWVLTPSTVPALLVACGHVRDADTATRVMRIAREHGVHVDGNAYLQLLDAMVRDDPSASFEPVLKVCDVIVNELGGYVPLPVLPRIIKAAAERGELERAMPFYHHPPDAAMKPYAEHHFDVCLLTLWDLRYVDEMLHILKHVISSNTASADLKERICKGLLRKSVEERKEDCREQAMQATVGVLELMEQHRIRASNKPFPLLLAALIEDEHVDSVDGFVKFFSKYPNVMEFNAFIVCELLLVAVRMKQVNLIDDLVAHALNNGIPLKYVALESVVAFYYRTGKFNSVEKAADIIRALRNNKHIPLGMALSEIGMACNLKLGRFEEVALLFEDFAALDGERKRILTRKPMLQAAVAAYMKLARYDEANAIRQLLDQHHPSDEPEADANDDSDDEEEEFSYDDPEPVPARSSA